MTKTKVAETKKHEIPVCKKSLSSFKDKATNIQRKLKGLVKDFDDMISVLSPILQVRSQGTNTSSTIWQVKSPRTNTSSKENSLRKSQASQEDTNNVLGMVQTEGSQNSSEESSKINNSSDESSILRGGGDIVIKCNAGKENENMFGVLGTANAFRVLSPPSVAKFNSPLKKSTMAYSACKPMCRDLGANINEESVERLEVAASKSEKQLGDVQTKAVLKEGEVEAKENLAQSANSPNMKDQNGIHHEDDDIDTIEYQTACESMSRNFVGETINEESEEELQVTSNESKKKMGDIENKIVLNEGENADKGNLAQATNGSNMKDRNEARHEKDEDTDTTQDEKANTSSDDDTEDLIHCTSILQLSRDGNMEEWNDGSQDMESLRDYYQSRKESYLAEIKAMNKEVSTIFPQDPISATGSSSQIDYELNPATEISRTTSPPIFTQGDTILATECSIEMDCELTLLTGNSIPTSLPIFTQGDNMSATGSSCQIDYQLTPANEMSRTPITFSDLNKSVSSVRQEKRDSRVFTIERKTKKVSEEFATEMLRPPIPEKFGEPQPWSTHQVYNGAIQLSRVNESFIHNESIPIRKGSYMAGMRKQSSVVGSSTCIQNLQDSGAE